MLPAQESIQHVENARVVTAIISIAVMVYWRLILKLLLVLIAVSTTVGAVVLLQIAHR